jgi:hypothetical protein
MMDRNSTPNLSSAALVVLIVLQLVMLFALFNKTPPHPPLVVPLFALGPFLGAALAIAAAALMLGSSNTVAGRGASVLSALMALISFGPQKWFDPAIDQIWPAVLLGEIAAIVIAVTCFSARSRSADAREKLL